MVCSPPGLKHAACAQSPQSLNEAAFLVSSSKKMVMCCLDARPPSPSPNVPSLFSPSSPFLF